MNNYTNVEEQVVFGLESIDPNRTIEVPMRDLMFAYQTIGLLINFFHQPLHYPTLESVEQFLGDKDSGAFRLLSEIYYKKLYDVWPEDIRQAFDDSRFENPISPYYYEPDAN